MRSLNEILMPTEFSPYCADVARYAAGVARHFGSKITLLHVLPPLNMAFAAFGSAGMLEEVLEHQREETSSSLNLSFADDLRGMAVKRIVAEGDAAETIAEYCASERVGLVMMPTRGCSAFRRQTPHDPHILSPSLNPPQDERCNSISESGELLVTGDGRTRALAHGEESRMLRVTKADEASRTIVTIDGQLTDDHIEVVETCCDQAISAGKPVFLFLRNVTSVEPAGYNLLRRLAGKGVHLLAGGAYILSCSHAPMHRYGASLHTNSHGHAPDDSATIASDYRQSSSVL